MATVRNKKGDSLKTSVVKDKPLIHTVEEKQR